MASGPLDDVFEQLSQMMEFLDEKGENLAEGDLPDGLKDQVDALRAFMAEYSSVTDQAIRDAGGTPTTAVPKEGVDAMSKRDEALMHRFEDLKKDLIQRKQLLEAAIARTEAGDDTDMTPTDGKETDREVRKKKRVRKKKFRGLGDDKWMKM